ncbi:MAG: SCP2 sterol-binding domain-containing protein [Lachnospiraceae bacterium]|nr:SCP2 sterol-binding domain-containing protein [Lachnospiraceae bacterium]
MNINIYYGGRGVIEDPTLYVLKKIESVFEEIHVKFTRYNLYDMKNTITTLPQTFKDADGIILADSVEWLGLGGYMHQFLDACWLYGDKTKISNLYMAPVVVSTSYGEKDAIHTLEKAWEVLGGKLCDGLCCYVEDPLDFEMNTVYGENIEKIAENIYRTISQKRTKLPSSNTALKQSLIKNSLELTPQESEQLSKYVSDDIYVKQQKEDIEELASKFKLMLSAQGDNVDDEVLSSFTTHFVPQKDFKASYLFTIEDKKNYLYIEVDNDSLQCRYEKRNDADVIAKISYEKLISITRGRITFQRAFMTGEMTAKGNFKTLRMLDQAFSFAGN